jgi:hypothetical protein
MRLSRWLLLNTGLLLFDTQWFTFEIVNGNAPIATPKETKKRTREERGTSQQSKTR